MTNITVYSATKLSAPATKAIESYLASHFPAGKPSYELDSSLLAGFRIVAAGTQLELSLSDLLDNMGKVLS